MGDSVQNSNAGGSRVRTAILLGLLFFVIYNSNLRLVRFGDSIPARLLPFSLILDRSFYLDEWIKPYLPKVRGRHGVYFAALIHGHWLSVYPILTPLVVSPLYVLPAWWLGQYHPYLAKDDVVVMAVIDIMEKLSASLLAALSGGVLYLALRKVASPVASLVVALVYGVASTTWTISSQSLWRHGLTELSFALLLWALLRGTDTRGYAFWVGFALATAAANKPPDGLMALVFFFYFVRNQRGKLVPFCRPLFVVGFLVLLYNLYFFGRPLGGYPDPLALGQDSGSMGVFRATWNGIAGLLVSPNRGLFIYIPWTVFALWGAVRLWKKNAFGWERYLILGMAGIFLMQARWGNWWGGWCFGPRYLTDMLPLFAFFLIPVWPRVKASHLLYAAFALATVTALWVQVVGAYYYRGVWDASPVSVELDHRRLWDWSDTQISRSWGEDPASPQLFYDSYTLFRGQ